MIFFGSGDFFGVGDFFGDGGFFWGREYIFLGGGGGGSGDFFWVRGFFWGLGIFVGQEIQLVKHLVDEQMFYQ